MDFKIWQGMFFRLEKQNELLNFFILAPVWNISFTKLHGVKIKVSKGQARVFKSRYALRTCGSAVT